MKILGIDTATTASVALIDDHQQSLKSSITETVKFLKTSRLHPKVITPRSFCR